MVLYFLLAPCFYRIAMCIGTLVIRFWLLQYQTGCVRIIWLSVEPPVAAWGAGRNYWLWEKVLNHGFMGNEKYQSVPGFPSCIRRQRLSLCRIGVLAVLVSLYFVFGLSCLCLVEPHQLWPATPKWGGSHFWVNLRFGWNPILHRILMKLVQKLLFYSQNLPRYAWLKVATPKNAFLRN